MSSSVGVAQANRKPDVRIVQELLNRARHDDPEATSLAEDGVFGPKTLARLNSFQSDTAGLVHSDGVAKTSGPTMRALSRFALTSPALQASRGSAAMPAQRATVQPGSALAALMHQRAAQPKASFKAAWINRALPAAAMVKANWGVPIAVTIAQGALESSWGRAAPGNVFFGVKAPPGSHTSINLGTHEVTGGQRHAETDAFRAYGSLEQSADDYGRFLATNKRYAAAFNYKTDPDMFIHMVSVAGYATDLHYEEKIRCIMAANGLKDYDKPTHGPLTFNDAVSIGTFA